MKELHRPEFDDLYTKNKLDFLKNAWKHKLDTTEQVQTSHKKPSVSAKRDSKIPGLNILSRKNSCSHIFTKIIDIDKLHNIDGGDHIIDSLMNSSEESESDDKNQDHPQRKDSIHMDKSIIIDKETLLNQQV